MKRRKHRKAITAGEMRRKYSECIRLERDRERKSRQTEQGAFESSFLHYDKTTGDSREREETESWLSDRGAGAEVIRNFETLKPAYEQSERARCINRARMAIVRNMPECLETFRLVLKNGKNKEESIWEMMQKNALKQPPNGRLQKSSILHK